MNARVFQPIVDHYEACLAQHGDTHRGVDWPNAQDAQKRYAVMLDVARQPVAGQTLLDFGCGASHLFAHMQNCRHFCLKYSGLDISNAFCDLSLRKYPANEYLCLDVMAEPEKLKTFDYVVMNGVFTEKRELSFEAMLDYFKKVLRVVFPKVRIGMAFNVMSKAVDWERDDLFHLPLDTLQSFLTKELSRHFVIRNDYGLYEYTVYVYREAGHG
jgi:cyclopropane fatty-acyl-phospholipid synthase-like methyltransferase